MTLLSIYDVGCPTCGQAPGMVCRYVPRNVVGHVIARERPRPHSSRRRVFQEATGR